MKKALFIGRFQPFHNGHFNAAQSAQNQYELTIGIGSAQKHHTFDNPLSAAERESIVSNCVPDVPIVRLEDQPDNTAWVAMVEATVDFDVIISGNSLVRELLGDVGHTVEDPDYLEPERFSGTAIRELAAANDHWQDRVPECSATLLEEYGFVDRLQDIS